MELYSVPCTCCRALHIWLYIGACYTVLRYFSSVVAWISDTEQTSGPCFYALGAGDLIPESYKKKTHLAEEDNMLLEEKGTKTYMDSHIYSKRDDEDRKLPA